jgi:hypothetical protein
VGNVGGVKRWVGHSRLDGAGCGGLVWVSGICCVSRVEFGPAIDQQYNRSNGTFGPPSLQRAPPAVACPRRLLAPCLGHLPSTVALRCCALSYPWNPVPRPPHRVASASLPLASLRRASAASASPTARCSSASFSAAVACSALTCAAAAQARSAQRRRGRGTGREQRSRLLDATIESAPQQVCVGQVKRC